MAARNILDEYRKIKNEIAEIASGFGLSVSQVEVLVSLFRAGRMCSVGEVAKLSGKRPSAVTSVLDGLEKAGWIWREPDREDRRRVMVAICPERRADVLTLARALGCEPGEGETVAA